MTLHGIGLVARQEIRTRLRTGRWRVLLAVWFLVVNGLALLFRFSLETADGYGGEQGVVMFGGVLLSILVLTLLVTPALSAQSINGDRERGTLATLQITRLTPLDITLGKLAAAWGTGLVVLGLTLPSALLPVFEGAITVGRAIVVIAVVALLIGVVCAVSQGWSALVVRSITSVLMSYLTVFALLVGTPILFTLALPLTTTTTHLDGGDIDYERERTELVWWMLAPNPLVVLADAAPRLPERRVPCGDHMCHESPDDDPLGDLGRSVREIRNGDRAYGESKQSAAPVWPFGLAFNLALAGGSIWITTRRLRTPVKTLPRGIRIA